MKLAFSFIFFSVNFLPKIFCFFAKFGGEKLLVANIIIDVILCIVSVVWTFLFAEIFCLVYKVVTRYDYGRFDGFCARSKT